MTSINEEKPGWTPRINLRLVSTTFPPTSARYSPTAADTAITDPLKDLRLHSKVFDRKTTVREPEEKLEEVETPTKPAFRSPIPYGLGSSSEVVSRIKVIGRRTELLINSAKLVQAVLQNGGSSVNFELQVFEKLTIALKEPNVSRVLNLTEQSRKQCLADSDLIKPLLRSMTDKLRDLDLEDDDIELGHIEQQVYDCSCGLQSVRDKLLHFTNDYVRAIPQSPRAMAVSEVPTTSIVLTNESLPILSHPETTSNGTTKGKGKASLFEGPAFLYDEEWTGLDIHTELRAATSVGSATLQVHSTVPDRELEYEELINKSQRLTKIDPNNICHIHGQYLQEPSASGPGKIRWDEKWERRQKNPKERYLGIGSQGSVYLQQCTFRPNHGQYRAVKEIPKKNLVEGYRELEAITFISISEEEQRYFVKSFGWYQDHECIYIPMEYMPIGDLAKLQKLTRPLTPPKVVTPLHEDEVKVIAVQLLKGLQYMHQNEFIHRDLKPENLLVQDSTYWKIKIGDFGISKSTVGTTARTQTGTRHFMAPEIIWQSRANYTKAVDIWSLGAVLFLMLTGQMLFSSSEKLLAYYSAKDGAERLFPVYPLEERSVSDDAVMFLRGVLAPLPWDRPGARECLLSPWLRGVVEPV